MLVFDYCAVVVIIIYFQENICHCYRDNINVIEKYWALETHELASYPGLILASYYI